MEKDQSRMESAHPLSHQANATMVKLLSLIKWFFVSTNSELDQKKERYLSGGWEWSHGDE